MQIYLFRLYNFYLFFSKNIFFSTLNNSEESFIQVRASSGMSDSQFTVVEMEVLEPHSSD